MNFSCLSVIRQGWLGFPLFLVGIVSLAFSQLAQTADNARITAEELVPLINSKLAVQNKLIVELEAQLADDPTSFGKNRVLSNLESVSNQDANAQVEVDRLKSNLQGVEDA